MMKQILLIVLCVLFVGLEALAQQEETVETEEPLELLDETRKPITEVSIEGTMLIQEINMESRINPDNDIQDLSDRQQAIEATAKISDYFDNDESWRWLFKTYSYRVYGNNESEQDEDDDLVRIDELFVDWTGENFFLNLGKRRISWGPALAFNPVNVIVPPRDPLNPDGQTEGQPLAMLGFATDLVAIDIIATRDYDRDWYSDYDRWGARFAVILDEMDFAVYYFDGEKDEDDNPYVSMSGFSFSSNFLSDSTLYLEVASFSENERNYYEKDGSVVVKDEAANKAVLGSTTTIDGNTSFTIELYYNSAGYNAEERENYFNTVDSIMPPTLDVSRFSMLDDFEFSEMNRTYYLLSYRKSDILSRFGFTIQILGAEDGSAIGEFEGDYNISDYYKFIMNIRGYTGDEDSEFGNNTTKSKVEFSLNASF